MIDWRDRWALAPGVTYLNHGSFGPPPRAVLEARAQLAAELAADPVDFLVRQAPQRLWDVRSKLGKLIGAAADDLVLTDNATAAMNLVAHSVPLAPGDEVLACDHEYGAVLRLWRRTCAKAGAQLKVVELPWPLESQEQVVAALTAAMSERTRLVVVSHVTSPTALILPVAKIVQAAHARGIAVAVDGPHALAMLPLDLAALGADFYSASCHKWLAAPFGTGFLHVAPRWQKSIDPLITSWGGDNARPSEQRAGWQDEFHWQGTRDPSSFLAIGTAIDFLEQAGWETFRKHGNALARIAREQLIERAGAQPLTTSTDGWLGTMAAVELPRGQALPLMEALWEKHRIEVPVVELRGRRLLRVSAHLYNTEAEVERLVEAVTREL